MAIIHKLLSKNAIKDENLALIELVDYRFSVYPDMITTCEVHKTNLINTLKIKHDKSNNISIKLECSYEIITLFIDLCKQYGLTKNEIKSLFWTTFYFEKTPYEVCIDLRREYSNDIEYHKLQRLNKILVWLNKLHTQF